MENICKKNHGVGLPDAAEADSGRITSAKNRKKAQLRRTATPEKAAWLKKDAAPQVSVKQDVISKNVAAPEKSGSAEKINGYSAERQAGQGAGESAPANAGGHEQGIPKGEGGMGDGDQAGIGVVDTLPAPVYQVRPGYPASARRKGINGLVVLSCLVRPDGRPSDIRVISSEPASVFDANAEKALEQWRFKPAMHQGRPVPCRVIIPFRFQVN